LIEGAGGLLAPLGENFNLLDLISQISSSRHAASSIHHPSTPPTILIVAPNRLGTLNHCLLTVRAMQVAGAQDLAVVLMGQHKSDPSAISNPEILSELLAPVPVHIIPFLGGCRTQAALESSAVRLRRVLARLL
jgi:dethiobiotin synthetase